MEDPHGTLNTLRGNAQSVHALDSIPPARRKQLREDAGLAISDLGDALGIPWRQMLTYENGTKPAGDHAAKYYYALAALEPLTPELTAEESTRLKQEFENHNECRHCLGIHVRACPRIKKFAYHPDGVLAEVEFWPDGQWPTDNIVFRDSPQLTETVDV